MSFNKYLSHFLGIRIFSYNQINGLFMSVSSATGMINSPDNSGRVLREKRKRLEKLILISQIYMDFNIKKTLKTIRK